MVYRLLLYCIQGIQHVVHDNLQYGHSWIVTSILIQLQRLPLHSDSDGVNMVRPYARADARVHACASETSSAGATDSGAADQRAAVGAVAGVNVT